jgi:hypothetical protein
MGGTPYWGYRILSIVLIVPLLFIGAALLYGFLANTIVPSAMAHGAPAIPTDYWGLYMMGFAGALLFTWGACLFSAVLNPAVARGVGIATAFGLILNAIFRMIAWFSGEYAEIGNTPRVEAAIMLLLAIGFIWLRPSRIAPQQIVLGGGSR